MSKKAGNFAEHYLAGKAHAEDIYSYIDEWHDAPTGLDLPEYLGMTRDEYALWLEKPDALQFILSSHAPGTPLPKLSR